MEQLIRLIPFRVKIVKDEKDELGAWEKCLSRELAGEWIVAGCRLDTAQWYDYLLIKQGEMPIWFSSWGLQGICKMEVIDERI